MRGSRHLIVTLVNRYIGKDCDSISRLLAFILSVILIYMEEIYEIINRFYADNDELRELLLTHSRCVARKALECVRDRAIDVDEAFVESAAMLHDIGIVRCNAPSIHCCGTEPYIRHGVEGGAMLRALGSKWEPFARVCERHTGSGITAEEIERENLPLPHRDFLPETTAERLICYADKFFSKSRRPDCEIPLEHVEASMARFGADSLRRFKQLHEEFGPRPAEREKT